MSIPICAVHINTHLNQSIVRATQQNHACDHKTSHLYGLSSAITGRQDHNSSHLRLPGHGFAIQGSAMLRSASQKFSPSSPSGGMRHQFTKPRGCMVQQLYGEVSGCAQPISANADAVHKIAHLEPRKRLATPGSATGRIGNAAAFPFRGPDRLVHAVGQQESQVVGKDAAEIG